MDRYLGNQIDEALTVVRGVCADSDLRIVNDGYENLIVIVDKKTVVRLPRTEEIWQRSEIERYVLAKLTARNIKHVPKLIKVNENPAYIVVDFLEGNQLSAELVRTATPETQRKIGTQIARFAYLFHQSFLLVEIKPFIRLASGGSYEDYLKRVLMTRTDPNPKIDSLAKEYCQRWMNRRVVSSVVVHDDLHTGNLLFNDSFELTGVLDFGAVCIGTPEQDLRQTFRLGEIVFESAISQYEKSSGLKLDREVAKTWTITQELAAYCREPSGVAHERAKENLAYWFPDLFDSH